MNRGYKAQMFEQEGRGNLADVVKNIKNYYRVAMTGANSFPSKIVFFTLKGEGPMLAYNQLSELNLSIIAVVFPSTYAVELKSGGTYMPEIPEKVEKFFKGVEIPVVRGRLPFDGIAGADAHNKEMDLIKGVMGIFGGSMNLAIQAVLQATDSGWIAAGEQVIAATSDTALLITASTTRDFLSKSCGLVVNEVICKPRNFNISRPKPQGDRQLAIPLEVEGAIIESNMQSSSEL